MGVKGLQRTESGSEAEFCAGLRERISTDDSQTGTNGPTPTSASALQSHKLPMANSDMGAGETDVLSGICLGDIVAPRASMVELRRVAFASFPGRGGVSSGAYGFGTA